MINLIKLQLKYFGGWGYIFCFFLNEKLNKIKNIWLGLGLGLGLVIIFFFFLKLKKLKKKLFFVGFWGGGGVWGWVFHFGLITQLSILAQLCIISFNFVNY